MADADVLKVKLTAEGIQDVVNAMKKVEDQTGKTAKAGKEAGDALGALGTIFAAQQIAAFAAHALEAADQLYKMSQKTGVAVEQLSTFSYMAQQADVSQEDLGKGFAKLSKNLDALNKGDATAADAFKRIGLNAQDLAGLGLDQIFLKVANAQSDYADGAGKAAVMMAMFGKSGASLIPLMNDLSKGGFEEAKKKLQELGLVIGTDTARAAQDFNDSLKRMEMAAQGVTLQVAGSMLPSLTKGIDGLVQVMAGLPAAAKAFGGSFMAVGAVATATTVAVRSLYGALAGLGPVGLAVVAISALVAGYMALEAAGEAARQEEMRSIANKGALVDKGEALEKAYRKEAAALQASGDNKKEAQKHSQKLKEIEDQLIALSPDLQKALKDETKDWSDKADAIKAAREQAQESLKLDKLKTEQEIASQERYLKANRQILKEQVNIMGPKKGAKPIPDLTQADIEADPYMKQLRAKALGIDKALGLAAPDEKAGEGNKKSLTAADEALMKARAAALVADAKRGSEVQKQALDEFTALNEDFYKRGLIDLNTYLAAKATAIKAQADMDIAQLQVQMAAEKSLQGTLKTPAERLASEQKMADLQGQIKAKQTDAELKLQALERTGRDLREKATDDALKGEAELEQAKGKTGEAAVKSLEAEYRKRIELAQGEEAKKVQASLRDTAIAKSNLAGAQQNLELGQNSLSASLGSVDAQLGQGKITEEEALKLKIDLYKQYLPLLEAAAATQQKLAGLTGNPGDLIKAKENSNAVESLKGQLLSLGQQMDWVKTTARNAFEQGLGNLLTQMMDQTMSLTDKIKALGKAIAQALLQAAAAKFAAQITTSLFGAAPGKATGGEIFGPGTSTSDSVPIWASRGEFVVRAAAVQAYGPGLFHALNGMQIPKGNRFAQGGLVGDGSGAGRIGGVSIGQISVVVTPQSSSGQAQGGDASMGRDFAERLRSSVVAICIDEQRPGGIFNRGR